MKNDKSDINRISKSYVCQVKHWFGTDRLNHDYVQKVSNLSCKITKYIWNMQKNQRQISSFHQKGVSINLIQYNLDLPFPEYRVLYNRKIKGRSYDESPMRRLFLKLAFDAIMQLSIN